MNLCLKCRDKEDPIMVNATLFLQESKLLAELASNYSITVLTKMCLPVNIFSLDLQHIVRWLHDKFIPDLSIHNFISLINAADYLQMQRLLQDATLRMCTIIESNHVGALATLFRNVQ